MGYVIAAGTVVALLLLMCWQEDGALWKNLAQHAGMLTLIAAIGGAIVWVATYGT